MKNVLSTYGQSFSKIFEKSSFILRNCGGGESMLSMHGRWIRKIHPTWIVKYFKRSERQLYPFLASPLSKSQQNVLQSLLNISWERVQFSNIVDNFFIYNIYKEFSNVDIVPFCEIYSSDRELSSLIKLSRKSLVEIMDLILIPDIAYTLSKNVNSTIFNIIKTTLSEKQNSLLSVCVKNPNSFPGNSGKLLKLQFQQTTPTYVKNFLHSLGLTYFANILKEEQSLLWYLSRILDKRRGDIVINRLQGCINSQEVGMMKKRILWIIDNTKRK